MIFLWRTLRSEAVSSGVVHKERHGGKINHSPDPGLLFLPPPPALPTLSGCLGPVAIRGLQKLISKNLRILRGAVLGSAGFCLRHKQLSVRFITNCPAPLHPLPTSSLHVRPSQLLLQPHPDVSNKSGKIPPILSARVSE